MRVGGDQRKMERWWWMTMEWMTRDDEGCLVGVVGWCWEVFEWKKKAEEKM